MSGLAYHSIPDESDFSAAELAGRTLAWFCGNDRVRMDAKTGGGAPLTFLLPRSVVRLLTFVLALLGRGRAITVFPQDAADWLGLSRPYLATLLQQGAIACNKVGTHRRVGLDDLTRYRTALDARQRQAAAELVAEGQTLGVGY